MKIENFIKRLSSNTGQTFMYKIETWAFKHRKELVTKYIIYSVISGFQPIEKETEQELIDSFDLIEQMVDQLLEVQATKKRIDTKLIGSYHNDDEL